MPIYFNEHVAIIGSRSNYNSGVIGRRYKTVGRGHSEAPMEVSRGIIRHIGSQVFEPGLYDDFTIMEDSTYPCYAITARGKKSKRYTQIGLDLYTVRRNSDLSGGRRDAVLIRKEDIDRVEVISGGGYYGTNQERMYDNIFLRAKTNSIVVIKNCRADGFQPLDQFYRIASDGVHRAYYGVTSFADIGDISEDLADWLYI